MFIIRILCLIMIVSVFSCASYPLDMTKDEWEMLSSQQKVDAREKQAELDLENKKMALELEKKRNKQLELERQKQRESDFSKGMVAEFYPEKPVCIGGDKCMNNKGDELVISLRSFTNVDVIQFFADDMVGKRHDGVLEVRADNWRLQKIDISKYGKWYQVFVGRRARNIVFKAITDDEVKIHRVKVFGSRINDRQLQYNVF